MCKGDHSMKSRDVLLRSVAEDCYRSFMGREIPSRITAYEPNKMSPERKTSEDQIRRLMGEELYQKLEDTFNDHELIIEKEFFEYGFRYAIALMEDKEKIEGA